MKKIILIACLYLLNSINAQTIERQVIGTSGSQLSNGGVTLNFTVGEIAVTSITNGSLTLNQGFHNTIINEVNTVFWNGSINTFWTEVTNWNTNVVPETTNDVMIPNTSNSPVINAGVTAEMNDLTVGTLAAFDISDNGVVIVNGNLQTSEAIKVASSANTSGTLIVKGSANGNVSFERTGLLANKWSIITAPVSGQSIKEFIENPANEIRVNATVTPNRYAVAYYDDSKPTGSKWTYFTENDIQTNALTFEQGKGYIISRATDGSVNFTGTLETTDISVTVSAGKWNSLGNPYTAYMPVNNNSGANFIMNNLSKFNPANVGVYIWNVAQNKYIPQTLVGAPVSLTVGQGFLIRTIDGVGTIDFKEAQRLPNTNDAAVFSRKEKTPKIQITAKQKGITVTTDINYLSNTTNGLDKGYDIGNFDGANFDIYTKLIDNTSKENFTIQSVPNIEKTIIPLGIKSKSGEKISISIKTENLPKNVEVYLEDKVLKKIKKLSMPKAKYIVNTVKDLDGVGRFYLHTKASTLTVNNLKEKSINIYNQSNNNLVVDGLNNENFILSVYNAIGTKVFERTYKGSNKNKINLNQLSTGVYVVKVLVNSNKGTSKKIVIK